MSIHPDTIAALRDKSYSYDVQLLRIDFTGVGGGVALYASSSFPVVWNGETYQPNGQLLSVGDVKESSELRVEPITFEFSGVDLTTAGIFLNNDYVGAPVSYLRAFLDSAYQIIGEPVIYFLGTVSNLGGSGDETSETIAVEADNQFANWEAVNGRRMNPRDVPPEFPNDRGLDFAGQSRQSIRWGR